MPATGASMRPPVLPSGNSRHHASISAGKVCCFNEAAGFTQRKRAQPAAKLKLSSTRASMRPPVLPSGNAVAPVTMVVVTGKLQ